MSQQIGERKRMLRAEFRAIRRSIPDLGERSERIVALLTSTVVSSHVVMSFDAVVGEPDVSPLVAAARAAGVTVVAPDPRPDATPPLPPADVDVVLVPGLAFTPQGHRLGQGGGWYDRFLAGVGPACTTIGVGFREQIVAALPVEPHDAVLDAVVSDEGWVLGHGT